MPDNRTSKRFRVFAGPNGSGKSTIIKKVKDTLIGEYVVDCGIYVNADDIAITLAEGSFSFSSYELIYNDISTLRNYAINSGLLRDKFTLEVFDSAFEWRNNSITIINTVYKENIAQVLSNFLIEQLIKKGAKCSMETVFSHESKVELLRLAKAKGYKVYLYFVATEDPEINKERVKARVKKGGHDVPPATIEKRYYKSLELLYSAAQVAYRCYFFDNSGSADEQKTVTNFKQVNVAKDWDVTDIDTMPEWFVKYYIHKRATQ